MAAGRSFTAATLQPANMNTVRIAELMVSALAGLPGDLPATTLVITNLPEWGFSVSLKSCSREIVKVFTKDELGLPGISFRELMALPRELYDALAAAAHPPEGGAI